MSFLSPGRLLYWSYHRPKAWWFDRRDAAAGWHGDLAMQVAASELPPADLPTADPASPVCRFLTGVRFFHQTIFCARSFEWACGRHVRLEIHGDGTLDDALATLFRRALPHVTIVTAADTEARLDRVLPASQFPLLRTLRHQHPLMRKLVDLHAGATGASLYLDSDMLFFRPPAVLRDWLARPTGEWFMHQAEDALVGDRAQLERTLGNPLATGANSGILALQEDGFDWPALEAVAGRLSAAARHHPWLEQTLFAWHLGRRRAQPLPDNDYCLCYGRESFGGATPVLRHYVHKAKALYAAREWRLWLERSRAPAASLP
jgi:hypothetical protein